MTLYVYIKHLPRSTSQLQVRQWARGAVGFWGEWWGERMLRGVVLHPSDPQPKHTTHPPTNQQANQTNQPTNHR